MTDLRIASPVQERVGRFLLGATICFAVLVVGCGDSPAQFYPIGSGGDLVRLVEAGLISVDGQLGKEDLRAIGDLVSAETQLAVSGLAVLDGGDRCEVRVVLGSGVGTSDGPDGTEPMVIREYWHFAKSGDDWFANARY